MDTLVIVEGQKIKLAANQSHRVAGSKNFVKFKFEFSDEWKNLVVCALFEQGNKVISETLVDGCVYLPSELSAGRCYMGLLGIGGTINATTNKLPLLIEEDVSINEQGGA